MALSLSEGWAKSFIRVDFALVMGRLSWDGLSQRLSELKNVLPGLQFDREEFCDGRSL